MNKIKGFILTTILVLICGCSFTQPPRIRLPDPPGELLIIPSELKVIEKKQP